MLFRADVFASHPYCLLFATESTRSMSDHASHDAVPASQDAPLFSAVEVEQFSADDVTAGGAIGKMLSALFLYTILAMGIAGWWTHTSIDADNAYESGAAQGETVEHSADKAGH